MGCLLEDWGGLGEGGEEEEKEGGGYGEGG